VPLVPVVAVIAAPAVMRCVVHMSSVADVMHMGTLVRVVLAAPCRGHVLAGHSGEHDPLVPPTPRHSERLTGWQVVLIAPAAVLTATVEWLRHRYHR